MVMSVLMLPTKEKRKRVRIVVCRFYIVCIDRLLRGASERMNGKLPATLNGEHG